MSIATPAIAIIKTTKLNGLPVEITAALPGQEFSLIVALVLVRHRIDHIDASVAGGRAERSQLPQWPNYGGRDEGQSGTDRLNLSNRLRRVSHKCGLGQG
jgi:hypothetical protein